MISDISPPDIEPVSLDYAKTFLRVDTDDDDALITDLIRSARIRIEAMIGGALIERPQRFTTTRVTGRGVFINHQPVREVSAVRLIGAAGEVVDVPLLSLSVNLRCQPPAISVTPFVNWRGILGNAAAVEIDITAGYGTATDDVPMPLRHAVLLLLAQSYEYRAAEVMPPTPMMVDALLMPYRSIRL